MKAKILVLIVALTSFIGGAVAGTWWSWHLFIQWTSAPKEVELSIRAALNAMALAHLRLNETTNAIQQLEVDMDGAVLALAQWDRFAAPDEETRRARDRWLVAVKLYRESVPASGDGTEYINALLAKVPGRNPQATCKSSVCRLDDLHRANLSATTNSVTGRAKP